MPATLTAALIGPGRAGSALGRALVHAKVPVVAVAGSSPDSPRAAALAEELGATTAPSPAAAAAAARVTFIAVPDSRIAAVAEEVAGHVGPGRAVAHLSGATPLSVLEPAAAKGVLTLVFHPVLPFPDRERGADYLAGAPVGITGSGEALELARTIAGLIGARPFEVADETRVLYHAACALASNGFVALYDAASRVAGAAGIDDAQAFLLPLVAATLENLRSRTPAEALTGPVPRGDAGTISGHVEAIGRAAPEALPAYRALFEHAIELADLEPAAEAAVRAALEAALREVA